MFESLAGLDNRGKERFFAAILKSQEADQLLDSGDHKAGVAAYREAISLCPPCELRGDYRILLGCHFFDQGETSSAEQEFLAALSPDGCSHPYEAYRRLAQAQAAMGKFEDAVTAMHRSAVEGEDLAYASQATVAFALALGKLEEAIGIAEDGPELLDCVIDYRQRLLMARADLAWLVGDVSRFRDSLNAAAALYAGNGAGMHEDVAFWMAALDRLAGRHDLRSEIVEAFADEADGWACLAWDTLCGQRTATDLDQRLAQLSWGRRAECLASYHRLAGMLREASGDFASARRHYESARAEPFAQWCIDYHLAGMGLLRVAPT